MKITKPNGNVVCVRFLSNKCLISATEVVVVLLVVVVVFLALLLI
jgi:hypothetical protein